MVLLQITTISSLLKNDLVKIVPFNSTNAAVDLINNGNNGSDPIIGIAQDNFSENTLATILFNSSLVECNNLIPAQKYFVNPNGQLNSIDGRFVGTSISTTQILLTSGLVESEGQEIAVTEGTQEVVRGILFNQNGDRITSAQLLNGGVFPPRPEPFEISSSIGIKRDFVPQFVEFRMRSIPFREVLGPQFKLTCRIWIQDQAGCPNEEIAPDFICKPIFVTIERYNLSELYYSIPLILDGSGEILIPANKVMLLALSIEPVQTGSQAISVDIQISGTGRGFGPQGAPPVSCFNYFEYSEDWSEDFYEILNNNQGNSNIINYGWYCRVVGKSSINKTQYPEPLPKLLGGGGAEIIPFNFRDISIVGNNITDELIVNPGYRDLFGSIEPIPPDPNLFVPYVYVNYKRVNYDGFAQVALPFQFNYYNSSYNQIYISTNGLVAFTPFTNTTVFPFRLPCNDPKEIPTSEMIAVHWTPLDLTQSPVFVTGTTDIDNPSNNQVDDISLGGLNGTNFNKIFTYSLTLDNKQAFIIQWNRVNRFRSNYVNQPLRWFYGDATFQLILFEDGEIQVHILHSNFQREKYELIRGEDLQDPDTPIIIGCNSANQGFTAINISDRTISSGKKGDPYQINRVGYRLTNGYNNDNELGIGEMGKTRTPSPIVSFNGVIDGSSNVIGISNFNNIFNGFSKFFGNWTSPPVNATNYIGFNINTRLGFQQSGPRSFLQFGFGVKSGKDPSDLAQGEMDFVVLRDDESIPEGMPGDIPYDFVDISQTGNLITDFSQSVPIGFDFLFANGIRTEFFVCKGGYITFDQIPNPRPGWNTDFCIPWSDNRDNGALGDESILYANYLVHVNGIPTRYAPESTLFALWRLEFPQGDGELPDLGEVYWEQISDDLTIVQWQDVGNTFEERTFQLKLRSNNTAEVHVAYDNNQTISGFSTRSFPAKRAAYNTFIGMQDDRFTGITNYHSNLRVPANSAYRVTTTSPKIDLDFEEIIDTQGVQIVQEINCGSDFSNIIDLGFDLKLYGKTFNRIKIGGSGLVTCIKDNNSQTGFGYNHVNQECPVNVSPNDSTSDLEVRSYFGFSPEYTIFANWTAIKSDFSKFPPPSTPSSIFYKFIDIGLETERLIIQWNNLPITYWNDKLEGFTTFQLKIYKNGVVESHVLNNGDLGTGDSWIGENGVPLAILNYWNKRLIGSVGSLAETNRLKEVRQYDFRNNPTWHMQNMGHVYFNDNFNFMDTSYIRFLFDDLVFTPGSSPPSNFAIKISTSFNHFDDEIDPEPKIGLPGPYGSISQPIDTPALCGIDNIINGTSFVSIEGFNLNSIVLVNWRIPSEEPLLMGQLRVDKSIQIGNPGFRVNVFHSDTGEFVDTGSDPLPFSWFVMVNENIQNNSLSLNKNSITEIHLDSVDKEHPNFDVMQIKSTNINLTNKHPGQHVNQQVDQQKNPTLLSGYASSNVSTFNKIGQLGFNNISYTQQGPPGPLDAINCQIYHGVNRLGGDNTYKTATEYREFSPLHTKLDYGFIVEAPWITQNTAIICAESGALGGFNAIVNSGMYNVIVLENGKMKVKCVDNNNIPIVSEYIVEEMEIFKLGSIDLNINVNWLAANSNE